MTTPCEWLVPPSETSPRHRCTEHATWERPLLRGESLRLCDKCKAELFSTYNSDFQRDEERHWRRVE